MSVLPRISGLVPIFLLATCVVMSTACSERDSGQEQVVWVNKLNPQLSNAEHFVLDSQEAGHEVGVAVHLPADYSSSKKQYPVVYFLHGVGGDETTDVEGFISFLQPVLAQYQLPEPIVVFPNGGRSQYQGQIEPMIINELIPYIDSRYRTISCTGFRTTAGFSMGGAGAIRLAIRHPEVFGGAVSWAGGMWHKDTDLLNAAAANAPVLRANGFYALMINGEHDRPDVFARLAEVFNEHSVNNKRVVLENVDHDYGLYLQKTGALYGTFIETLHRQNPTPADCLGAH